MVETAAYLVDQAIPPLPVRQWVLSVQKRRRLDLERVPRAVSAVPHILLRDIAAHAGQGSGTDVGSRRALVKQVR
jgi:hypothetical protein